MRERKSLAKRYIRELGKQVHIFVLENLHRPDVLQKLLGIERFRPIQLSEKEWSDYQSEKRKVNNA